MFRHIGHRLHGLGRDFTAYGTMGSATAGITSAGKIRVDLE
jgi:hypothetical protein